MLIHGKDTKVEQVEELYDSTAVCFRNRFFRYIRLFCFQGQCRFDSPIYGFMCSFPFSSKLTCLVCIGIRQNDDSLGLGRNGIGRISAVIRSQGIGNTGLMEALQDEGQSFYGIALTLIDCFTGVASDKA